MTRTTASVTLDLEEDKAYKGTLRKTQGPWIQTSKGMYGEQTQLVVDWELNMDGGRVRDWLDIKLGDNIKTGKPAKLRQMLNALAGLEPETEVWFDPDTLEWGYQMEDGTPAFGKLTEHLELMFKGEIRKNLKGGRSFKITAYKRFMASAGPNRRMVADAATADAVDVDPDKVPF